jgi:hypothetical protein
MSPVDLERKVRQIDNDVQSIYELINKISTTQLRHGNRITELTEMVAAHDLRFDAIDARFDGVDARFGGMDARLDRMETNLEAILGILRGGSAPPSS